MKQEKLQKHKFPLPPPGFAGPPIQLSPQLTGDGLQVHEVAEPSPGALPEIMHTFVNTQVHSFCYKRRDELTNNTRGTDRECMKKKTIRAQLQPKTTYNHQ